MTFQHGHTHSKDYHARRRAEVIALDPDADLSEFKDPRSVSRFSMADLDSLGQGLLERMTERWPHISAATFAGRIQSFIGSNDYLFIRTDGAVGLATRIYEGFDPAPVIIGLFAWPVSTAEYAERRETNRHILSLCREMERWGRSMRAREFRPGDDMMMQTKTLARVLEYTVRDQAFRRL